MAEEPEQLSLSDDKMEEFAIRCARGNNSGDWSSHYTEDQKNFWRKFVRELVSDIEYAVSMQKISN
jgi:hypothetical protein